MAPWFSKWQNCNWNLCRLLSVVPIVTDRWHSSPSPSSPYYRPTPLESTSPSNWFPNRPLDGGHAPISITFLIVEFHGKLFTVVMTPRRNPADVSWLITINWKKKYIYICKYIKINISLWILPRFYPGCVVKAKRRFRATMSQRRTRWRRPNSRRRSFTASSHWPT